MIKVSIKKCNGKILEVAINGHAKYDDYGKDIVCAAVSSISINSVNNILALEESIEALDDSGFLKIRVLKETDVNQKILDNLIYELSELKSQYPKNIEIRNEE